MSDYKTNVGKLKLLATGKKNILNTLAKIHNDLLSSDSKIKYLNDYNLGLSYNKGDFYKTILELFACENDYGNYFVSNDNLYQIIENKSYHLGELNYLKENSDGTFDFVLQYYDGGGCFEDALEYILKNNNLSNKSLLEIEKDDLYVNPIQFHLIKFTFFNLNESYQNNIKDFFFPTYEGVSYELITVINHLNVIVNDEKWFSINLNKFDYSVFEKEINSLYKNQMLREINNI